VKTDTIGQHFGQIDMIVEATGIASLDFDLLEALGINGVFVLTGIPTGHRPIQVNGADLMQKLVLRNQVMVGSVNASEAHFARAVADLHEGAKRWPDVVNKLISSKVPVSDIEKVLENHPVDEIKTVIQWQNHH
jgi:threonine dehydrogenase-like Zn-dependent dehydrogenase